MAYNITALVVDDDDHVRGFLVVLIRRLLEEGVVLEARNGKEAIEIYQRERPDLVLLDVNMPHMNGMDALLKIREINPEAVIIMITSLATRRIVEDAADRGASNFIRKDTPKSQILEVITTTIEQNLLKPANTAQT
jgi:two-component system chemotaxis response regulator CheY